MVYNATFWKAAFSLMFLNNGWKYPFTTTLQRQFRLYIPFLGIARPQPQFPHACVFERFTVYIPRKPGILGCHWLNSSWPEYFCLKDFFPDQERKIPGNPEFPEVFLARKSLISDILGFSAADGDYFVTFLSFNGVFFRGLPYLNQSVLLILNKNFKGRGTRILVS
jgi:hypothetical protein